MSSLIKWKKKVFIIFILVCFTKNLGNEEMLTQHNRILLYKSNNKILY